MKAILSLNSPLQYWFYCITFEYPNYVNALCCTNMDNIIIALSSERSREGHPADISVLPTCSQRILCLIIDQYGYLYLLLLQQFITASNIPEESESKKGLKRIQSIVLLIMLTVTYINNNIDAHCYVDQ